MRYRNNLGSEYSPLYFLASLGNGGLAITFFMYLMFMIPHPGHPIPTFEDLAKAWGRGSMLTMALMLVAVGGILVFAGQHYRLLWWNIREYVRFKGTPQFTELKQSNAEVQLMAIPLTYAMAVNVLLILGALFVPSLWTVVEYLFPVALTAFALIGVYAIVILLDFFGRILAFGQFDCEKNNSLSQMLSIFAISMVAVGLAAPAAMSHNHLTSGFAIILSVGFISIALVLSVVKIVLGFRAMFEHGISKESAISLWIIIPILTVLGIAIFRISMGLHHNFDQHVSSWQHVILFTVIIVLQLFFGLLGHRVMGLINYFGEFISGASTSVMAYAAICPGVALVVMGNFFINKGIVAAGLLPKFSIGYVLLYLPLIFLQFKTIQVLGRLNRGLLKRPSKRSCEPAQVSLATNGGRKDCQ